MATLTHDYRCRNKLYTHLNPSSTSLLLSSSAHPSYLRTHPSLPTNNFPDFLHDFLPTKIYRLKRLNAIIRAPTPVTPVTPPANTAAIAIVITVVAYSTAFDVA